MRKSKFILALNSHRENHILSPSIVGEMIVWIFLVRLRYLTQRDSRCEYLKLPLEPLVNFYLLKPALVKKNGILIADAPDI